MAGAQPVAGGWAIRLAGGDPIRTRLAAVVACWWPGVEADRLTPDYAGGRPKLSGPGEPAADFATSGPTDHGSAGLVNLFGMESPP